MSTENRHIFQQWVFVCFWVCLHFVCSFVITFIAVQCSDNLNIQGTFWIGKWSKCLSQSCSLRPALNFSFHIQSCRCIAMLFSHVFMYLCTDMTCREILQYHAVVQKDTHLQSLLLLFSVWCGDWRQFLHKNLHILAYLCAVSWITCQFPYIDVEKFWVFALAAGAALEDWSLLGGDTLLLGK